MGSECNGELQISPHDSNFVSVFVNVRAIFAVIGSLVLQPAEARHINFVAGLQFFRRVGRSWLWCGILSGYLPRGKLEFGSYGCFNRLISSSGCSSRGASCRGIVPFSFSASAVGSSISATVASLALTAVSAAGTGVCSVASLCGHTAAHKAAQVVIRVTI